MKALLFFAVLYLNPCPAKGESDSKKAEKLSPAGQIRTSRPDSQPKDGESQAPEGQTSAEQSAGPVDQQIRTAFESFLKILEKESVQSGEYTKAVRFLKNSLYNEAGFESLRLLAEVYGKKNDLKNQINVLKIISSKYPENPESFYLLGEAYKDISLIRREEKAKECAKLHSLCVKASGGKPAQCAAEHKSCVDEYKQKSIESLNQAIKLNKKYVLAHKALLDWLMTEDPKTGERMHTKDSLFVVMDMLKSLRSRKYYIDLCKAYYDNKFFKQSRRACAKSVKRNPKDPTSPLILALSAPDLDKAKKEKQLLSIADKFKKSFFVQYKIALYFMDKAPHLAISYFESAFALQPENLKLNRIMARFLFDNGEEESSYKNFLKACHLSEGVFLGDFRQAKSALRRKQKPQFISKFQKGIEECSSSVRAKKRNKKN